MDEMMNQWKARESMASEGYAGLHLATALVKAKFVWKLSLTTGTGRNLQYCTTVFASTGNTFLLLYVYGQRLKQ